MSLNMYRLIGDLLHMFSILYIFIKLITSKSCGGLSGKTQFLFLLTYLTRYVDLITASEYQTLYMVIFKSAYLTLHCVIAFLIFVGFRKSYRRTEDKFSIILLLIPCVLLAFLINHEFTPVEILWTFSVYLESVAVIPQFYMIYLKRQIEISVLLYLIPLGFYRLFYIFNWVYRYLTETHYDEILEIAGLVYVSVYIIALILFLWLKVEITKNQHYLKKNIFFISINDPNSELTHEKGKNADEEKMVPSV